MKEKDREIIRKLNILQVILQLEEPQVKVILLYEKIYILKA